MYMYVLMQHGTDLVGRTTVSARAVAAHGFPLPLQWNGHHQNLHIPIIILVFSELFRRASVESAVLFARNTA